MDCRTTAAHKFRTRLGFKQFDLVLTKEQTRLSKIKSSFEGENMQTKSIVLGYGIDLHFRYYKLTIEIYEKGHSDRYIDYEIKQQKAKEEELGCELVRIDLTKKSLIL